MKKSIATLCAGLLALLSSSVVFAATVTVTPSTANPVIGTQFTLTVSGAGFPDTVGATLQLTFDPTKVAVFEPALGSGIVLAPGSPFTGGIAMPATCTPTYTSGSACNFSLLAPTVGALPTGNFDAFQIVFTALAVGSANIVLVDDGADFTWTDGTIDALPIPGITYTQASVTVVATPPEPNISVTDSVVPTSDLAVAFGNVTVATANTQTVTVTNTGGLDLTIGAVASANALALPFSIVTDLCSSQVLTPLSSCTVTVTFTPAALVSSSDDFNIPSDDPDSPTVTVAVNGTGTPAVPNIAVTDSIPDVNDRTLAFGNLTINTTTTGTVTVTNSGEADLTVGAITPPAAPFSITTNTCTAPLAPLSSCTITVQFAPGAVQAFSGSFAIPSDDPDEPSVPIDLSGAGLPVPAPVMDVTDSVAPNNDLIVPFGNITQGGTSTQTVTVANSGNADLIVGQVASVNPLAAPFTLGTNTCSGQTVAPAAFCTFQVVFEPTALGVFNDALDIPASGPGMVSFNLTVSVSGTGIAVTIPDITVTDSVGQANDLDIPFGDVDLSAAAVDQTVTVTNDGSGDLVIGVLGTGNPLAAPFSIAAGSTCSGATLAPAATCTIVVRFDPTAEGNVSDSFSIPSNDPDEATVTMAVSGTGTQSGSILIDGGSSALDPWSLAFLGGLPLLRRRRRVAALKLAMAAAAGVLAAPVVMADDTWDWDYDGVYLGAGAIGTSLQTSSAFDSALQSELGLLGIPSSGGFEDFPLGGQLYAGWMFTNMFGMEIRWSDSGNGDSDILFVDNAGARTRIGGLGASIDGFTLYGVGNWHVADRFDLFGKLGYTRQDAAFDGSVDDGGEGGAASFTASDDDVGPAAALGARWRFARHFASTVEVEYLGVDFDNTIDKPWRVGLNLEYWFGGNWIAAAAPVAVAAAVAAPPPPPPPPAAPVDSDGDGVVDASDQCADTPAGDRVGSAGCSCDVTRQLTFKTNSAELSDADKLVLDEMAENLTRLKFISGVIEGHTDSSGADAYNQGLSERRAQVAADYLVSRGIASDRLQIVGRGETDPVGDNTTAEGRAQNRRVVAKRTDCDK
jgi:outer membrane protein OmpA-like peptidoglycan-associated protein